jgi:hypothetical protein
VKRKKSVREQRNRKTIVFGTSNNRKKRIRPMDIIPLCHEISSNKGKVLMRLEKFLDFLNLQEGVTLEEKSRAFAEKGRIDNVWAFNSILRFTITQRTR